MRRHGISTACRTYSLPGRGKAAYGFKKSRKLKPRVSFSTLPPAKIEFESETESSENQASKITTFNARVAQFLNEKDKQRSIKYDQCVNGKEREIPQRTENEAEVINNLDSVNELLMDIIEEIEAENITVEDCLRDAISMKVIDVTEAKTVLVDFEMKSTKTEIDNNNNNSIKRNVIDTKPVSADADLCDSNQKSVEKLLDLLSTLKTVDLSKCCKYTLGKLCQLTSYEDYENVQKRAANSRNQNQSQNTIDGRIPSDEDSTTSEFPEESSYTDASCLSSSSSDNFEESSGLGSENEFQNGPNFQRTNSKQKDPSASAASVKQALPTLIDEGVLKPRQVWGIMGSKDSEELLRRFISELSFSLRNKQIRETENDHDFGNNFWINQFIPEDCDSSVFSDLGYCSLPSDRDSPTSDNGHTSLNRANAFHKFGKATKSRPFTITSARSRQAKFAFKTSTPTKLYRSEQERNFSSEGDTPLTCKDYAALVSWCKKNELPARTAYILHCNECNSEEDLLTLDVENARYFQDLPWNARGQLIIAIESLRLEKQYIDMKNKLDRCASVLKSVTS